jgi:hypothetical protein
MEILGCDLTTFFNLVAVLTEDNEGSVILFEQLPEALLLRSAYPVEFLFFINKEPARDLLQLSDLNDLERCSDQLTANINHHVGLKLIIYALLISAHLHRNILDDSWLDAGFLFRDAIHERLDPGYVHVMQSVIELTLVSHVA